jgi:periplasmic protein TonB
VRTKVLAGCAMVFAAALATLATLATRSTASQEPQRPVAQPQDKPVPSVSRRIRVGGQAMQARVLHKVNPKYPKDAKKNHIEGTVRLRIVIDRDGRVIETNVDSGDPALAKAATDAVREWRYRPTLLNGQPVQVVTQVDVHFSLHGH